jgi:amidohydrolase
MNHPFVSSPSSALRRTPEAASSTAGLSQMAIPSELQALLPELTAWRRDFHRFPELGYAEHRTAAKLIDLLRTFGVDEIAEGIAQTGVVAVLRNGEGPCVALRADMDALPITEKGTSAYRSSRAGIMHACGHDGHMSILLGAAHYLAGTRRFRGTVVLVFQPAEEGLAGAKAMLQDGLLERFRFEKIFGLHNLPGCPAGELAVSPGTVMAAVDCFEITVTGRGGHSAMPHLNRDPIVAAASLIMTTQSIVSRNRDPQHAAVVSITRIAGGEADNATPDRVTLRGNVRFLQTDGSDLYRSHLQRIAHGTADTFGVSIAMDYEVGRPATVNSELESMLARQAAASLAPDLSVAERQTPMMASEDFSYFLQERPGAFAFLGCGEDRPSLHSADYDFNDAILVPGAAYLSRVAELALQ